MRESYRIGRLLGRGAVASVHEVHDAEGRRFAAKILHASHDGDAEAHARFEQEARLLEGLEHPHLVRVHGLARGVDEQGREHDFLRMELIEGPSLDVLIARQAPLSDARAAELGRQLAEGLAHAHGHGIVHRDLKPANVLVADPEHATPRLAIADFGLARASSLGSMTEGALTVLGTPDYMAPESIEPLALDARSDLYALGCILYEMLTGQVPFSAATPFGVLRRHREDPLPPLPDAISPAMRALVESLLAKSPADRPASAGLVASRLAAIASGERSLVPIGETIESSCASCGHALVEHIAVCLNCGLPSVTLEPGRHAVLITGPGAVGDKLDAALREQLRGWIERNPQLGLRGGKWLEQRIPRLPIVFASGIAERSGEAMVASLRAMGFAAEVTSRWTIGHPLVRAKATRLAGRVAVIWMTSLAGLMSQGGFVLGMLLLGGVGALVGTTIHSARAVTHKTGRAREQLGSELRGAFDAIEAIVPTLDARHRHALRAMIRQVLALRAHAGPEIEGELARALVGAGAATSTLARIDRSLQASDLHRADDATRTLLHERDRWSGRMLELAGALEALRARAAAAALQVDDAGELDELRLRIEALEEVQR